MLPHPVTALATRHTLPYPWETIRLDLCSTQLQIAWVTTPVGLFCATLAHSPTPNWVFANFTANLHGLLGVLAPLDHQLRVSGCPYLHIWYLRTTAS